MAGMHAALVSTGLIDAKEHAVAPGLHWCQKCNVLPTAMGRELEVQGSPVLRALILQHPCHQGQILPGQMLISQLAL